MAETSYNLTNIVKVTQDQYTTLKNGGTIGSHTYDSKILYLVKDDPSYTVRRVTSADPFNGAQTEIFYYVQGNDGYIYIIDTADAGVDRIDMGVLDNLSVYHIDLSSINLSGITNYEEYVIALNDALESSGDEITYASTTYVENTIANAITSTLNGSY